MSSSAAPSDQIVSLFNEYRENDSVIEQLKAQLHQSKSACERLERSMQQSTETLSVLEFEHHQLRKAQITSSERISYLENEIQKEKDAALMLYNDFVEAEGAAKEIGRQTQEHRTALARECCKLTADHLHARKSASGAILAALRTGR